MKSGDNSSGLNASCLSQEQEVVDSVCINSSQYHVCCSEAQEQLSPSEEKQGRGSGITS